ncbi:MAG: hypothetical protein KYX66_15400, partial [Blastomonas fulva]|uniref:hypothetical protein n=1 Tax=Blastomonas fulva TaxID=1550728 RepID=UPI0024E1CB8D
AVKQRFLRHRPFAHHRPSPLAREDIESILYRHCKGEFFNRIGSSAARSRMPFRGTEPPFVSVRRNGRSWQELTFSGCTTDYRMASENGPVADDQTLAIQL